MNRPTDQELRKIGASLREIDPSTLAPDVDGARVRWFLGEQGTEIYVWHRLGQKPHHVQLVFSRVSVEWSDSSGLVTGAFKATPTTAGGRYDPYLLTVGRSVDNEVCGAALVLLDASTVDPAAIEPLRKALSGAVGWEVRSP